MTQQQHHISTVNIFPDSGIHVKNAVLDQINDELNRAVRKHGFLQTPMNPNMDQRERFIILAEEVGEVARAMTYDEGDPKKLIEELIQVAAMAAGSAIGLRLADEHSD